ncbi:MAG TPA: pyruvate kinase [Acidimicrobiales bacterium]|jgi:pyruvate kinase|nr:pyruvate kinase [Acidimicrobiales bacterium]
MPRRTKIVATIGPASDNPKVVRGLLEAGMDVARVGLAHGPIEGSIERIEKLRAVSRELARPVGILVDLPGPKVRTAPFDEDGVRLDVGSELRLSEAEPNDHSSAFHVAIDLAGAVDLLEPGDRVALGDGGVTLVVEEAQGDGVLARVLSGGVVRGRPGVALPADRVPLRSPTEADLDMLERVIECGVDAVAVSFVQSADDVATVRMAVGPDGPMVVAKIETAQAVEDLDAIVHVSDGVMVARGDLGVRLPLEDVPHIQKRIIRSGVAYGKPVITATQMLESMITAPTPTRAEVTDVANAVFDGTSAVMLSAETAIGVNPVAVVEAMARITLRAEREFDYEEWGARMGREQVVGLHNAPMTVRITSAITAAAWRASVDAELAAIIACTDSGRTARMISRFRPTCPILAMTPNIETARRLTMAWGIKPLLMDTHGAADEIVWHAVEHAARLGLIRAGDLVGVLVGAPHESDPTTDVLRLVRVR